MDPLIIRELAPNPESGTPQQLPAEDAGEEISRKSGEFTPEQDGKMRILINNLHRLNDSIVQAVESGLTVEIKRASRFHGGAGNWGDQIYLAITRNA